MIESKKHDGRSNKTYCSHKNRTTRTIHVGITRQRAHNGNENDLF